MLAVISGSQIRSVGWSADFFLLASNLAQDCWPYKSGAYRAPVLVLFSGSRKLHQTAFYKLVQDYLPFWQPSENASHHLPFHFQYQFVDMFVVHEVSIQIYLKIFFNDRVLFRFENCIHTRLICNLNHQLNDL